MNYTTLQLKERFGKFNFKWPDFHLIGIRSNADIPNEFDDQFILIIGNEKRIFTGTTNPGTHWLLNWLNPKGTAVLEADRQYLDTWTLGQHNGKYEAFVQAKAVRLLRDADKNLKSEGTLLDIGFFGINIHRASETNVSKFIDKWSAGCQVLNNPKEFAELMALYKLSGNKFLTYTLLKEF